MQSKWLPFFAVVLFAAVSVLALIHAAWGHDPNDPELDVWYAVLKMPDNPNISCCGKADAYWCDDVWSKDEQTFCRITDTRDDKPLGRPHIDVGTIIQIPPNKFGPGKWGNPTGHAVVFLSYSRAVYCFIQGSGV